MLTLIPAILIFMACFLFALVRPKIAIYLPLVFSCAYLVRGQVFGLPTTLLEIILLGVLVGVWMDIMLRSVGAIHELPLQRSTVLLVAIFALSATVSAFIAIHPHTAWGVWKAMIVEPIIYVITLIALIDSDERARNIVRALLLGGLVSSVLSLISLRFGVDFWRFRGIYDVPNSLALIVAPLCVMGIIGSLPMTDRGAEQSCSAPRSVRVAVPDKLFFGFFALVFGGVLVATQSIAALIAVVITVYVILAKENKGRKGLIAVALLIILGLGLQVSTGKLSQLFNKQSSSLIAREQIWYTTVKMIERHPFVGTGLGTFEPAYQTRLRELLKDPQSSFLFQSPVSSIPSLEWLVRDPHNIFLSFWLNTGLLGLVSMLVLLFVALKKTFMTQNRHQLIPGAALLTLVIFGLFDVPYWKNDLALIWWVLILIG